MLNCSADIAIVTTVTTADPPWVQGLPRVLHAFFPLLFVRMPNWVAATEQKVIAEFDG